MAPITVLITILYVYRVIIKLLFVILLPLKKSFEYSRKKVQVLNLEKKFRIFDVKKNW